ncbi:hypothetical protein IC229_14785 [Spirosoma sp. BT702]|uniref:Peptidase M4 n=1 Tax=Spirosoma profusum TaxID=2771354 RepID=A0A926Y0Y2_9BACT|nr:hypothetical protein [Spirosoma profusum]MBD2701912.1 hypothetical protein [Spirosoma profusum]
MTSTPRPPFRKLRGYAFDPALALQMETAPISTIVYKVPWEDRKTADSGTLDVGPVGEYVEVIDYDPTVQKSYLPVDLNNEYILAQDGLDPSEGNPQFHQQMVYAVVMTTITNFERALGRRILWATRRPGANGFEDYVARLRIYPHALREANAYYSPRKKALLFGYFSSAPANESIQMPASLVFTCLSHDIIAHETTHAILDGMQRNYNEPTNPDVLAFHEAFSDIVALFQHFTFPDVLKNQIQKTRGNLADQNILGQLAQQFGSAIGNYGSLRDAIGEVDEKTGQWRPKTPLPEEYRTILEPHARGSILVAAVFEAFINIYKSRIADLLRIASNGTGILTAGELPVDLVNRLADEAAKSADQVLQMCIRALDYCPPVDITFGDYLRAIITADVDLVADDSRNYRLAFIDAFRRRGIYPKGIKTLSVESLQFEAHPRESQNPLFGILTDFLRKYRNDVMYVKDRKETYTITQKYMGGDEDNDIEGLHDRIFGKFDNDGEFEKLTGLVFSGDWKDFGINASRSNPNDPAFEVQNLRLVSRIGPQGKQVNQIVFSLLQRSGVKLKQGIFDVDAPVKEKHFDPSRRTKVREAFVLRGGCTLIFDLDTLALRYAIAKPLLDTARMAYLPQSRQIDLKTRKMDKARIEQQYQYQHGIGIMGMTDYSLYFKNALTHGEPFAFLHNH